MLHYTNLLYIIILEQHFPMRFIPNKFYNFKFINNKLFFLRN